MATKLNEPGNKLTGAPTNVRIPPNYAIEPTPGKLEQLLKYNEHDIYHKYKPYTENTNLLKFGREQPYIYTYIDEKNKPILPPVPRRTSILQSQAIPIESGTTDLVRITRYLTSGRGIEFLTKQLLLQAQQPYDETGVYNPLEVPLSIASSTTIGIIPRPVRHVNISGNVLGALASLVGINISNGNSAPPSSVGQEALPFIGSTTGKGLLRATTANKAAGILHTLYPPYGPPGPKPGFFKSVLNTIKTSAVDTFKAFFKPIFPVRQKGVKYRADEIMWGLMRADSGRLNSYTKDEVPVTINDLRKGTLNVLVNNRVYKAINQNESVAQYNRDYRYIDDYVSSTSQVSVVDTSITTGNPLKNYRLIRAGAGDGINQLGVLNKRQPNDPGSIGGAPIKNIPESYTGWDQWVPYRDDIIAFFFYDVVNEKFIPFRATVKGINDTTTAHWDELRFIGRADQVYTYNGFTRQMAFQFTVVITSIADLLPTWQKINYLKTSLKPAGYTVKGNDIFNRFMIPPMFMLTIGDMYKYQPIVIQNVSINVPENSTWETLNENNSTNWEYLHNTIQTLNNNKGKYAQLPKEVDISLTCNLLEKERAIVGGVDFGHAPRDENWKESIVDPNKPYLPDPTKFSENLLVDVFKQPINLQKNSLVVSKTTPATEPQKPIPTTGKPFKVPNTSTTGIDFSSDSAQSPVKYNYTQ